MLINRYDLLLVEDELGTKKYISRLYKTGLMTYKNMVCERINARRGTNALLPIAHYDLKDVVKFYQERLKVTHPRWKSRINGIIEDFKKLEQRIIDAR